MGSVESKGSVPEGFSLASKNQGEVKHNVQQNSSNNRWEEEPNSKQSNTTRKVYKHKNIKGKIRINSFNRNGKPVTMYGFNKNVAYVDPTLQELMNINRTAFKEQLQKYKKVFAYNKNIIDMIKEVEKIFDEEVNKQLPTIQNDEYKDMKDEYARMWTVYNGMQKVSKGILIVYLMMGDKSYAISEEFTQLSRSDQIRNITKMMRDYPKELRDYENAMKEYEIAMKKYEDMPNVYNEMKTVYNEMKTVHDEMKKIDAFMKGKIDGDMTRYTEMWGQSADNTKINYKKDINPYLDKKEKYDANIKEYEKKIKRKQDEIAEYENKKIGSQITKRMEGNDIKEKYDRINGIMKSYMAKNAQLKTELFIPLTVLTETIKYGLAAVLIVPAFAVEAATGLPIASSMMSGFSNKGGTRKRHQG